jgi:transposase
MLNRETQAQIRHLFYAEHWKIGTIAQQLGVHPDAVRRAVQTDSFHREPSLRPCLTDPYVEFVRTTLEKYPRLRATRIFQMVRDRGYPGSVVQLRRLVARLRPVQREAFLRLAPFPGEQAQADWAHFGEVPVGRARRRLSCFLITLSYSRALYLEFFFDQTLENLLRGHVRAFASWSGVPRITLYDNMRSVVLERRGDAIHFHPRLLEFCAHYHCLARPCAVRAGNQKGRVERAVRYVRESFWAGRDFTTLEECNRQALLWRDEVAHQRPWPGDDSRTVAQAFAEEQPRLLPLPAHPFETDLVLPIRAGKTIYLRFDRNDYSIPPGATQRWLSLVASESTVRILEGTKEIARGAGGAGKRSSAGRCFRSGRIGWPSDRPTPPARYLWCGGVALCHPEGPGAPRASSVAFILNRRQRSQRNVTPTPLDLSRHPEVQSVDVTPHNLESYDELTHKRHEPDE